MNVNSSGRTIIINGLKTPSLLYSATNKSLSICTMTADVNCAETQKKGRKRSLEHLSFEEKLLRKKLKNREAAQSSRDRKKARMDELEHTVKLLQRCNKELTSHVKELQNAKGELELENDRLREEVRCLRNRCTLESKTGSAESVVFPLLKGHSSHLVTSSSLLLIQMIAFAGWLKATSILPTSTSWSKTFLPSQTTRRITTNSSTKWWGRHQRCWNPVDQNHPRMTLAR